jgi:hypothetical protein
MGGIYGRAKPLTSWPGIKKEEKEKEETGVPISSLRHILKYLTSSHKAPLPTGPTISQ